MPQPPSRLAFDGPSGAVMVEVRGRAPAGLDRLYRPLRRDAAGARDPVRILRVHGSGEGFRVDGVACSSESECISLLEQALTLALLEAAPDRTCLHAAGAVPGGVGAVLAVGPSGAGKSSLALAWARSGVPLLGDDTVWVEADGRVRAFPRLLKVDRARAEETGVDPGRTVAPDPEEEDLWVDPVEDGGGWARGAHPAAVVAEVGFRPGAATELRELSAAEGLRRILNQVQPAGVRPPEALDRLVTLVEGARMVVLIHGSSRAAATALLALATGEA